MSFFLAAAGKIVARHRRRRPRSETFEGDRTPRTRIDRRSYARPVLRVAVSLAALSLHPIGANRGKPPRLFTVEPPGKPRSGVSSPGGKSATTHRQRADDSPFFAGRGGIGPAERTNAFARHTPSQMARAGMTMLDLAVLRNAETFRGPFVGLQFRHLFTILQKIWTLPDREPERARTICSFRL